MTDSENIEVSGEQEKLKTGEVLWKLVLGLVCFLFFLINFSWSWGADWLKIAADGPVLVATLLGTFTQTLILWIIFRVIFLRKRSRKVSSWALSFIFYSQVLAVVLGVFVQQHVPRDRSDEFSIYGGYGQR